MASSEEALRALRDAVQLSPDNVPLRQHLADTLLNNGRPAEAEKEYRHALTLAPNDRGLKVGLAQAFYAQGKNSPALVVLEALMKQPDTPASAYLLYARLLFQSGDVQRSVAMYREAIDLDSSLADAELANHLGLSDDASTSPVVEGRVRQGRQQSAPKPGDGGPVERPDVTFTDVGGMEALKDEIRFKIIHPMAQPELYAAYGKGVGGGILLYGPPGCGKTHLARATAGEVRAGFLSVGINDVLDMWVGGSERNLHVVFENARAHKPCVLFFDEADALGARRADFQHAGQRQMINQFLAELDGVGASNQGVLVLAATNAPWHLDSAFRRPGRFDRVLFVPPPDAEARAAILRIHCRGKPVDSPDFEALAKKTEGFSGADLKGAVDVAVERKLREAMKDGVPRPLTTKDLAAALASAKPSTKEWFATARNYALYANQGGVYDDILKYLKL
jgi:AAA+ superfamily predicted ATPase